MSNNPFKHVDWMVKDDCPACHGMGWYNYDHNHGKICEQCCPHNKGWWLLQKYYGEQNGKYACMGGCGTVREYSPNMEIISKSLHNNDT